MLAVLTYSFPFVLCQLIGISVEEFVEINEMLTLGSISYVIRGTNAVQNLTKQGLTSITAC